MQYVPDRGDLSSSNFPKEIKRIELGDDGRVSQSTEWTKEVRYELTAPVACNHVDLPDRHSRQINSFNV